MRGGEEEKRGVGKKGELRCGVAHYKKYIKNCIKNNKQRYLHIGGHVNTFIPLYE